MEKVLYCLNHSVYTGIVLGFMFMVLNELEIVRLQNETKKGVEQNNEEMNDFSRRIF